MKLLILRLEGALQSWGERSHWDHRDTANFPTKSGVVGYWDARWASSGETRALPDLQTRSPSPCAPTGTAVFW